MSKTKMWSSRPAWGCFAFLLVWVTLSAESAIPTVARVGGLRSPASAGATVPATRPRRAYKVVHVVVALCDNRNQGIVPVPAALGNGQDAGSNLYWGAQYGVKTFFSRSEAWKPRAVRAEANDAAILARAAFRSDGNRPAVWVVTEAYDGAKMKEALRAFFEFAAGARPARFHVGGGADSVALEAGSHSDMICFVGHDGLMDAALEDPPKQRDGPRPECAVVLACKSRLYFAPLLRDAGCPLLVSTTGLMCPEAYTLDAVVRSWAGGEEPDRVLQAAAAAYAKYQKCSLAAASRLFVTGMEPP